MAKVKAFRLLDGIETECDPFDAEYVKIRIPVADYSLTGLPVILKGQRCGTNCWSWNGDMEKPTFNPSILTKVELGDGRNFVCHSFVTDGFVQFLSDCTHGKGGTSEELLDIDAPFEWSD